MAAQICYNSARKSRLPADIIPRSAKLQNLHAEATAIVGMKRGSRLIEAELAYDSPAVRL